MSVSSFSQQDQQRGAADQARRIRAGYTPIPLHHTSSYSQIIITKFPSLTTAASTLSAYINGHGSPGSFAYLRRIILQFLHQRTKFDALTGFKVLPVTLITLGTYVLIWGYMLRLDGTVPDVASLTEQDSWGVSVEEAYAGLVALTKRSHSYNSAQIDVVGRWLAERLEQIIGEEEEGVELFCDDVTGVGMNATWVRPSDGVAVYFEGRNIMVYIHGTDRGLSPALVNAHYDSVSTSHDIFLNLEGGGTGGRAILFRANDTAVNGFYEKVPRPLRSTFLSDAYKLGALKSATDYDIFRDALHMRGLDVAFYTHWSRYHTPDDDMRYASKRSISHMLLTALYTVNTMTADTSLDYNENLPGKPAVYFDFFNRIWTFYEVNTLFAWSLRLLIVPAITLSLAISCLGEFPGWKKGIRRFPLAFSLASASTVTVAMRIHAANPLIMFSSLKTVWATLLSTWYLVAWGVIKRADLRNPTALARGWAFAEVWVFMWLMMLGVAYLSSPEIGASGGYFMMALYIGAFLGYCISIYELFIVRDKGGFKNGPQEEGIDTSSSNESLDLQQANQQTVASKINGQNQEEPWSVLMPNWTWLVQFLLARIYNIYAFPFTPDARFKTHFIQSIDLTTNQNRVKLTGNTGIINRVLPHLPSTFSTRIECGKGTPGAPLSGLMHCTWAGLAPNVTSDTSKVSIWVKHSIEKLADEKARVMLQGKNTRACRLFFDKKNVTSIDILDSPSRDFGSPLPTSGTNQLRLWSREPGRIWRVELAWDRSTDKEDEKVEVLKNEKKLKRAVDIAGRLEGRIVCLWSDTNGDEIPALNEVVTLEEPPTPKGTNANNSNNNNMWVGVFRVLLTHPEEPLGPNRHLVVAAGGVFLWPLVLPEWQIWWAPPVCSELTLMLLSAAQVLAVDA
ncbi:hypothetical protein P167DRAFT_570928 [Morchella conica CCBAS932]|uniref:Peptide hydrolase n=1 Tax=Morchella conica CCBAS932 TaxID=1392247 RepID=A0A3N4L079_9PEZI|nr:hypothetical protein P167DRAFT_570928 [Morchella conica CCBAS932]